MSHEQEARELPWYHELKLQAVRYDYSTGKVTKGFGDGWGVADATTGLLLVKLGFGPRIKDLSQLFSEAPETAAERDALKQQVATLTAQRDKAVEALRVFADQAESYSDERDEWPLFEAHDIQVKHLRQADAVVREIEQ